MAIQSQWGARCQKRTTKGHDLNIQDGLADALRQVSPFPCNRRQSQQGHADSIRTHEAGTQDINGPRDVLPTNSPIGEAVRWLKCLCAMASEIQL